MFVKIPHPVVASLVRSVSRTPSPSLPLEGKRTSDSSFAQFAVRAHPAKGDAHARKPSSRCRFMLRCGRPDHVGIERMQLIRSAMTKVTDTPSRPSTAASPPPRRRRNNPVSGALYFVRGFAIVTRPGIRAYARRSLADQRRAVRRAHLLQRVVARRLRQGHAAGLARIPRLDPGADLRPRRVHGRLLHVQHGRESSGGTVQRSAGRKRSNVI